MKNTTKIVKSRPKKLAIQAAKKEVGGTRQIFLSGLKTRQNF